jgi:formimidoylglutamate deiminase
MQAFLHLDLGLKTEKFAMSVIYAKRVLTPRGWRNRARLIIEAGRFASIETDVETRSGDQQHEIVIPGMPNLHSHAFQRGMAGLAERREKSDDTFWSWREVMYRFALTVTPPQVEAIAGQLYVEMLEAGFTRVGEFHYLHHDADGRPYANLAEMATRIASAAEQSGIGLTLLPVFYAHSTFAGAPPSAAQRRFVNSLDGYARLLDASKTAVRQLGGAIVGAAPHSLRATTLEELREVAAMTAGAPIHIHIAEQTKEVDECVAWSGARPVEWLLSHIDIDSRWCLIHATHVNEIEVARMAASRTTVGLCPITEANLGDGTFAALAFLDGGGRFGIGSDSNVLVGVAGELRQLEYSQRLLHRTRNVLSMGCGSTGRMLFDQALSGGAAALGLDSAGICTGASADFVSLVADHPSLVSRDEDGLLDGWIFAAGTSPVDCVWVAGQKHVEAGRHVRHEMIGAAFRNALKCMAAS